MPYQIDGEMSLESVMDGEVNMFLPVPSSMLDYEEGVATFTELTDGKFRIPFSKPHDTLPFFYIVQEADTEYTEDCIVLCAIMNYEAALGVAPEATDRSIYGTYTKLRFASSLSRITGTIGNMTSKTGDTAESLSAWVTTEEILANDFKGNPILSYTVGHQYKWLAVWNKSA